MPLSTCCVGGGTVGRVVRQREEHTTSDAVHCGARIARLRLLLEGMHKSVSMGLVSQRKAGAGDDMLLWCCCCRRGCCEE